MADAQSHSAVGMIETKGLVGSIEAADGEVFVGVGPTAETQAYLAGVGLAFKLAQAHGKIISLDPNYSPQIWPDYREATSILPQFLRYATITKPSLDDAVRLFGRDRSPEEYIEQFHEMGPKIVVFTMGSKGVLLSEEGRLTQIAARPIKVVDATGAGDSFWAGFLVAVLDGNPLHRCVRFAREIVEHKLTTVGPLADNMDRQEIYARVDAESGHTEEDTEQ